jgi:hypothetical protein
MDKLFNLANLSKYEEGDGCKVSTIQYMAMKYSVRYSYFLQSTSDVPEHIVKSQYNL